MISEIVLAKLISSSDQFFISFVASKQVIATNSPEIYNGKSKRDLISYDLKYS